MHLRKEKTTINYALEVMKFVSGDHVRSGVEVGLAVDSTHTSNIEDRHDVTNLCPASESSDDIPLELTSKVHST